MEDLTTENWKIVQTKTFTKWVNSRLKKAGFPTIESIFTDLSSGVALANLLAALGKSGVEYNPNARSRIEKMENLTIILDYIKGLNISLVNIGSEDIVDGDQKLILGLIWTLISRLAISEILTSEFFTMRDEILHWAQRVTEGYKNVNIQDLSTSWQDGLGFNAIIHKFREHLIDFDSLDPSNRYENCENAFKVAEEALDIPRFFDPDDIIDAARPDEKSLMTYLSQFYQKFHPEEKQVAVKDRLKSIFKAVEWSIDARNSYERRAAAFLESKALMNEKISALASLLSTFADELAKIRDINTDLIAESVELHLLLNDIQDVHRLMCLKSYHPPEKCSIDKLDASYLNVQSIFDLESVKREVSEFCNAEANELSALKELSNRLYSITDKEQQLAAVAESEIRFAPLNLSSDSKQVSFDRLRAMFEAKKEKLKRFLVLKNATDSLVAQAKKMFAIKDLKKTGSISISDLKKILMALRFDLGMIESVLGGMEGFVTCDRMVDVIMKINYAKTAKSSIRNAFKDAGYGEKVEVGEFLQEGMNRGLSELVGDDGLIEVSAILRLLDD